MLLELLGAEGGGRGWEVCSCGGCEGDGGEGAAAAIKVSSVPCACSRCPPTKAHLRQGVVVAHICCQNRVHQQPPREAPLIGRQPLQQVGAARAQHSKGQRAVVVLLDCGVQWSAAGCRARSESDCQMAEQQAVILHMSMQLRS